VFQRPFDAIASVVVPVVADAVDPDDLVDRIDVNALVERIDVDALLGRIDVNTLVGRLDLDTVIDRIDVDALLDRIDLDKLVARIDLDAIVDRIDIDRVVSRVDLDAIVDRVDVERVVARVDLDAIVDRVDVERVVARVDLDAIVDRVDVDRVVARVDLDAAADRIDVERVVARVDLDAIVDRVDVDRVVARVDVDAIAASLDIDTIVARSTKGVFGRFIDLLRRQVVGVDEISMRAVSRLLRRDYDTLPAGPPLAVGAQPHDETETMSGRYAGPISRLGAIALDVFLISSTFTLLIAGIAYLIDVLFGASIDLGDSGSWLAALALLFYGFFYFWFSQALTGRTISQALVGLKVIRSDGEPLGPGAAAIRTIVLPFSFLFFGIGALMALVDRRRRALQDVAAGSSVVYDWGDRPAALPAPITRFLDRREVSRSHDSENA
jgi:uncharacterized RDD family membrane protein YckC